MLAGRKSHKVKWSLRELVASPSKDFFFPLQQLCSFLMKPDRVEDFQQPIRTRQTNTKVRRHWMRLQPWLHDKHVCLKVHYLRSLRSLHCRKYCPNSPEVKAYTRSDPKLHIFFIFFHFTSRIWVWIASRRTRTHTNLCVLLLHLFAIFNFRFKCKYLNFIEYLYSEKKSYCNLHCSYLLNIIIFNTFWFCPPKQAKSSNNNNNDDDIINNNNNNKAAFSNRNQSVSGANVINLIKKLNAEPSRADEANVLSARLTLSSSSSSAIRRSKILRSWCEGRGGGGGGSADKRRDRGREEEKSGHRWSSAPCRAPTSSASSFSFRLSLFRCNFGTTSLIASFDWFRWLDGLSYAGSAGGVVVKW